MIKVLIFNLREIYLYNKIWRYKAKINFGPADEYLKLLIAKYNYHQSKRPI